MRLLAISYADPGRPVHLELPVGELRDDGSFAVLLNREPRGRHGEVSLSSLPLRDVTPPFAAAHRGSSEHPIVAVTDWLGFRAVYWWQGRHSAGLATSARELAAAVGADCDQDALGVQSLLGWQLDCATPFAGVRKLPAGHLAILQRGRIEIRGYAAPQQPTVPGSTGSTGSPTVPGSATAMARVLQEWLGAYLDTHDDPVLQLTGGHDSRILLGAIPQSRRRGLRTLTLDTPGGRDAPIARALSARYGMRHEIVDTTMLAGLSPAEGYALAADAARRLDCAANPLALAPLTAAESVLDQGRRLSGLGGEVARGFYYGAQPEGRTSRALAERFAHWRLFTNEAVDSAALVPEFAAHARQYTVGVVTEQLMGYSGDWLRALDEFYLWQRMQHWAGAHGTVAAVDRAFCNPMLDGQFIELARAASPSQKRDSRLLGQIMYVLDPDLAAIALDSGRSPRQCANGRGSWRATTTKVARKVVQRVTGGRRAPLGAALMARLVVAHWRENPSLTEGLPAIVRSEYVEELVSGRRAGDPATVAFLLNLAVGSRTITARRP